MDTLYSVADKRKVTQSAYSHVKTAKGGAKLVKDVTKVVFGRNNLVFTGIDYNRISVESSLESQAKF